MISYNTPTVTTIKAQYILNNTLGGLMWFEVSKDKNSTGSLIDAAAKTFSGQSAMDQTLNNLNYPTSKHNNLRDQFD
jgi:chitinase